MTYNKYLDTYRFIAVSLVIVYHWLPSYFTSLFYGKLGVDMFFVLSGFLITGILLREKKAILEGEHNISKALKVFYIRRGLRIFPVYYLLVFFLLIIGYPLVREFSPFFCFYGVNFLVIKKQGWLGMLSHLWSLSVEEQFYLVWPALILFAPIKYLKRVLITVILISCIYITVNDYSGNHYYNVHLLACAVTLTSGALIAMFNEKLVSKPIDGLLLILFAASVIFYFLSVNIPFSYLWLSLSFIFFSSAFIILLSAKTNRLMDIIFGNSLFCWLGKVSYGLYLYHNIIPWLLRNLNGTETYHRFIVTTVLPVPQNGVGFLLYQSVLLILVTGFSWYVIEKPINALKRKYAY